MDGKLSEQYLFTVKSHWQTNRSKIFLDEIHSIESGTPAAFGGTGDGWTPEHLLLASVVSCFLSTFSVISTKMKFTPIGIECSAIGHVRRVDGILKFDQIDIYPKLIIEDEKDKMLGEKVMTKTHKHCIVANSLNSTMYYHDKIEIAAGQLSS